MTDRNPDVRSTQARQAEIAQEIFSREREANRAVPLDEFLTQIDGEARKRLREEQERTPQQRLPLAANSGRR